MKIGIVRMAMRVDCRLLADPAMAASAARPVCARVLRGEAVVGSSAGSQCADADFRV